MNERIAAAYKRGQLTVLLLVAIVVNGGLFVFAGDRWYVALFCGIANVMLMRNVVRLCLDQTRAEFER